MSNTIKLILGVVLLGAVTYGGYWVAKNVSYAVFYEDMVEDTIKENVKKSCLRGSK